MAAKRLAAPRQALVSYVHIITVISFAALSFRASGAPLIGAGLASSATPRGPAPKAFIHVGPHKTASTHIQTQMCSQRSMLEAAGIAVPVCQRCRQCEEKHFHALLVAVNAKGSGDNLLAPYPADSWDGACSHNHAETLSCFAESLTAGKDVFLSSESFITLTKQGMEVLADLLSGYEVHVVMFYR